MAGHSRLKDGVASARLSPAIHVLIFINKKDVDGRDKPGHDGN
jgi:signal recognition particle receptor subunit beta